MTHVLEFLIRLEPVLLLVAGVAYFKSGSARRMPALGIYFVVRGASLFVQDVFLLDGNMPQYGTARYTAYFYSYWVSYIVLAIAIFFVVQEIFKRVMEPVPGLRRLGLLTFRWISIASLVVSIGSVVVPTEHTGIAATYLKEIGPHVMGCVSILELCLLAFLALSIHTLGRSFRSRLFGVGLGFGVQAATDLIASALVACNPNLGNGTNLFNQFAITMVLVVWTVYFLVPEPAAERSMIVLPPNGAMARWNALAKGIGQTPEAAVAGQPSGFFLQDIEGVVDRVLAKNPVVVGR